MVAASSDGRRSKRANPLDNAQADPTGQRVPLFILPVSLSLSLSSDEIPGVPSLNAIPIVTRLYSTPLQRAILP